MPEPLPAGRIHVVEGVGYAVRSAGDVDRVLELDVHRAPDPGAGPAPLIVFVHGGGWRTGSRASFGPLLDRLDPPPFERLARAGFVVASIDYRLSDEAVFPAQLDDVLAAVTFLRRRAAEFGADPDRIVLWGESAGGHLVALAALALTAGPDDRVASGIVGVVDWYGPADLAAMPGDRRPDAVADPAAPDSRESLLLGRPLLEAGELATAASPALLVHPGAPPFHLAHGTLDRFVPTRQSIRLRDALLAQGIPAELELVAGADHFWRDAEDPEGLLASGLVFARKVTAR